MDSRAPIITAISDAEKEAEVATRISLLGYEITARCYERTALISMAEKNPASIILADAEMYSELNEMEKSKLNIKLVNESISLEMLDQLLLPTIESQALKSNSISMPAHEKVIVFASLTPAAGVSTLALEFAEAAQSRRGNVLFIDAHQKNAFLSDRFEIHGIRSKCFSLPSGLRISELDVTDSKSICAVGEEIPKSDVVVVDLGVIDIERIQQQGNRSQDRAITTLLSRQCHLVLIEDSLRFRKLSITQPPHNLVMLNRIKDFHVVSNKSAISLKRSEGALRNFSIVRDFKSVEKALVQRATLSHAVPKSLVVREISRFAAEILG